MLPRHARTVARLLERLPGVGERTAARDELHARVKPCVRCGNLAEVEPDRADAATCDVCLDSRRDPTLMCVVARVQDLAAIERSGAMRGRYFVLGKLVSPLEGVGPDDLPLDRLKARIAEDGVR